MQSKANTVAAYLEEIPEDHRTAMAELRRLCLLELRGYTETMRYGMPCYEKDGVTQVSFASQKNSINLYILKKEVMDAHRPEGRGISTGKGCIRYSRPEKIDFGIVRKLLKGSFDSSASICG